MPLLQIPIKPSRWEAGIRPSTKGASSGDRRLISQSIDPVKMFDGPNVSSMENWSSGGCLWIEFSDACPRPLEQEGVHEPPGQVADAQSKLHSLRYLVNVASRKIE